MGFKRWPPPSTPKYGAAGTITVTLASLASDSTLIAGRASTAVDNTTTLAIDFMVGGFTTVSSQASAVSSNKQIEVWAFASYDARPIAQARPGFRRQLLPDRREDPDASTHYYPARIRHPVHQYEWGPLSLAQAYGGTAPPKWGVFLVQNSCAP